MHTYDLSLSLSLYHACMKKEIQNRVTPRTITRNLLTLHINYREMHVLLCREARDVYRIYDIR